VPSQSKIADHNFENSKPLRVTIMPPLRTYARYVRASTFFGKRIILRYFPSLETQTNNSAIEIESIKTIYNKDLESINQNRRSLRTMCWIELHVFTCSAGCEGTVDETKGNDILCAEGERLLAEGKIQPGKPCPAGWTWLEVSRTKHESLVCKRSRCPGWRDGRSVMESLKYFARSGLTND
jgi:hypothetical protein